MKNLTEIHVVGGKSLAGNISIQGSKNAALPMMAAALMHRGLSILKGCPKISDVFCMEEILENLGAVTWWENHDLYLDCTNADKTEIPGEFTRRMRSSVILLSAILARNHSCRMGLRHRKKTYRYSPDGIKEAGSRYPGGKIRT
mgnify:CR=1 FL=1